jgi:hypothetical protein
MHKLFSVKDCATCHSGDPEATAGRPWTEERLAGLRERMRSETQAAPDADLGDCLSCHTSHSDCGSCHH